MLLQLSSFIQEKNPVTRIVLRLRNHCINPAVSSKAVRRK